MIAGHRAGTVFRRVAVGSAVGVAVLLAGLAVLEVGVRCFLWIRNHPYDSAAAESEVSRILLADMEVVQRPDRSQPDPSPNNTKTERFLHPYFGWETAREIDELEKYARILDRNEHDALRILIVGGTAAEAFGREAAGTSGPSTGGTSGPSTGGNSALSTGGTARLSEVLRADPRFKEKRLRFLACGIEGYKEPQQVNLLLYCLDLGIEPDVVINIDGFDEVALGNDNEAVGVHPVFPAAALWGKLAVWGTSDRSVLDAALRVRRTQRDVERWGEAILRLGLTRSALLGRPALLRLLDLHNEFVSESNAYEKYLTDVSNRRSLRGPSLDGGETEAIEASASAWFEGSRCLHGICRGRGIQYLHVLHPALPDKGSKRLTPREIEKGRAPPSWTRGVELGYPMLRAKGAELARRGVNFVDASMIFADTAEDVYVDSCRLEPVGQRIVAEMIGQELLQRWPAKR